MFLPPLDPILGPEAQKMHFLGFWGSIHVFLHVKMAKKSILRPGTLFFRLLGGWSPFMWSGFRRGLPLDPSGCYWDPICPSLVEGSQLGPNWALWGPIGGPIGAFGTPIGGQLGLLGPQLRGQLGLMGPQLRGQLGLMGPQLEGQLGL